MTVGETPLVVAARVDAAVALPADPAGYAPALYAALRALEDRGRVAIAIGSVPAAPEWEAVGNRLRRAVG